MIDLLTLAFCAATAIGSGPGGGEVEVRIRTSALARGTDVRLGELCEITPINRATLEIAEIVFAPSPSSGRARTVTRTEIVQTLAAAGYDVGKITFAGPTEVVVQPVLVGIPPHELLESSTAALQALLAVEGGDVEVEPPAQLRLVETPPGRRSRDLVARVRGGQTGPTSAVVDIDVVIDGVACKRVPISFKLHRYQMLLKTVGAIREGAPLGPQNLELAREPLAQATGLYLTRLEDVQGMIAARNLQSNSRITLGDVAPPAVIRRGDVVTVVLTRGRIKVTAKAMANHDAPMAARISLTNLQSKRTLTGVVAAPGLVVVHN